MKTITQTISVILSLGIAFAALLGCSNDSDSTLTRIDCLPCKVSDESDWGFITREGKVILEDEFKNEPSPVIGGLFSLPTNDGYTVYRLTDDGNYSILNSLEHLASVGYFNNNRLPISRHGGMIEVVDGKGETVFTLSQIDGTDVASCFSFHEGIMPVMLADTTMVYVDKDGSMLFGRRFLSGTYFRGGHAVVRELPKDGSKLVEDKATLAIINTSGKPTFIPDSDYSLAGSDNAYGLSFHNGFITLERRNKNYIYDLNGKLQCQCPASVEELGFINEDQFIYSNDDMIGMMNFNCERVIRPHYEFILPVGKYFVAMKESDDEEILLIDKNDNVIRTYEGEDIFLPSAYWYDFPLVVEADDEMYLIDSRGNIMPQSYVEEIDVECIEDGYGAYFRYIPLDDNPGYVKASATATNAMLNITMKLLGQGTGIPTDSIVYFTNKSGHHCTPYDISFIRSVSDRSKLLNTDHWDYTYRMGDGYSIELKPYFDEKIAYKYEESDNIYLNLNAWCNTIYFYHDIDNSFIPSLVAQKLVNLLDDAGCELQEEKSSKLVHGYLMLSTDSKNYIAVLSIDTEDIITRDIYCMVASASAYNRKKLISWIEQNIDRF